jgi:hypothetical protein
MLSGPPQRRFRARPTLLRGRLGGLRRKALIVATTAALVPLATAMASTAETPSWSARVLVDHHPLRRGNEVLLEGIACPSLSLCVAVGPDGAFESSTPTAAAPSWSAVPGAPTGLDQVACPSTALCIATGQSSVLSFDPSDPTKPAWHATSLSFLRFACPSVALCVGSDGAGGLVISTDPGTIHPTWRHYPTVYESRQGSGLDAIACASVQLCLGVDTRGQLVSSTDPAASVPHWHIAYAPGPYLHSPAIGKYLVLDAVSCPSTTFCMVMDETGKEFTSSDPGAQHPTWTTHPAPKYIDPLSCPSTRLCVGNVQDGVVASTNDPTAARPRWTRTTLSDEAPGDRLDRSDTTLACVLESTTCVVAEGSGYVVVGAKL